MINVYTHSISLFLNLLMMKKKNYPLRVSLIVWGLSLGYLIASVWMLISLWTLWMTQWSPLWISLMFNATFLLALFFWLSSALLILRQKEALYIVLLISLIVVIVWSWIYPLRSAAHIWAMLLLVGHVVVLRYLSLECFGALRWWWNYRKKK